MANGNPNRHLYLFQKDIMVTWCPKVCVGSPSNSSWWTWEFDIQIWRAFIILFPWIHLAHVEGAVKYMFIYLFIYISSHISLLHIFNTIPIVAQNAYWVSCVVIFMSVLPLPWLGWSSTWLNLGWWIRGPSPKCGPSNGQSRSLPWSGADSLQGFRCLMMFEGSY